MSLKTWRFIPFPVLRSEHFRLRLLTDDLLSRRYRRCLFYCPDYKLVFMWQWDTSYTQKELFGHGLLRSYGMTPFKPLLFQQVIACFIWESMPTVFGGRTFTSHMQRKKFRVGCHLSKICQQQENLPKYSYPSPNVVPLLILIRSLRRKLFTHPWKCSRTAYVKVIKGDCI